MKHCNACIDSSVGTSEWCNNRDTVSLAKKTIHGNDKIFI